MWSRLEGLGLDEWFIPAVLVSRAFRSETYCSGAVLAVRREALERIGGFAPLAAVLADDYEIGARIRGLGDHNVIPDCEVSVIVHEASWQHLIQHELRWHRTTRTVTPVGHALLFLTYAVPLAAIAALVNDASRPSLVLLGLAVLVRIALHWAVGGPIDESGRRRQSRTPVWMLPLRDVLCPLVWALSYAGRTIVWRGRALWVGRDGVLRTSGARMRVSPRPSAKRRAVATESQAAR